jgi:hypothetical protein
MTLGSHQRTIGKSQVRITPRAILDPLGAFDTDPCAASPRPWDCAERNITEAEYSLSIDWRDFGRVWLNPPFDRRVVGDFINRMCGHDHGIALVHVRTETEWFRPIWERASALLFLAGRYIFHNPDGTLCAIESPSSKYFGKPANSGAPLVLAAFGWNDADVLCLCGIDGHFVPLRVPRSMLVEALSEPTWREAVAAIIERHGGPVSLADLYRAFADHPKTKRNENWREKVRQTLNRGGFRKIARGVYAAGVSA